MNNIRKAGQHGKFNLLFMEPMQHIQIISDFCPSNRVLVCDELDVNTLQKNCFIQERVNKVRVVMEV